MRSGKENPNALLEAAIDLMDGFWKTSDPSLESDIQRLWQVEKNYFRLRAFAVAEYPSNSEMAFKQREEASFEKLKGALAKLQDDYLEFYQDLQPRGNGSKNKGLLNFNFARATRALINQYNLADDVGEKFDLDEMIDFVWKLETGGSLPPQDLEDLKLAYKNFYIRARELAVKETHEIIGRDRQGETIDDAAYEKIYEARLKALQDDPGRFLGEELQKVRAQRDRQGPAAEEKSAEDLERPEEDAPAAELSAAGPEATDKASLRKQKKEEAREERERVKQGIKAAGGTMAMFKAGVRQTLNMAHITDESLALVDRVKESLHFLSSLNLGQKDEVVRRELNNALDQLERWGAQAGGYGAHKEIFQKPAKDVVSLFMGREPAHIREAFNAAVKAQEAGTARGMAKEAFSAPVIEEKRKATVDEKTKRTARENIDKRIDKLKNFLAAGGEGKDFIAEIYAIGIRGGLTYAEFKEFLLRETGSMPNLEDSRMEVLMNLVGGRPINEDAVMEVVKENLQDQPEFSDILAAFESGRRGSVAVVSAVPDVTSVVTPQESPEVSSMTPVNPVVTEAREDLRNSMVQDVPPVATPQDPLEVPSMTPVVPVTSGVGEDLRSSTGKEDLFASNSSVPDMAAVSAESEVMVFPERAVNQPQIEKYLRKEVDQQLSSIYEKLAYLNSQTVRNEHQPILDDIKRKMTQARAMGNSKQFRDAMTHQLGRLQHQNNLLTYKVSSKLANRTLGDRFLDSGFGRLLQAIFAPFRPARPATPKLYPAVKPVSVATASAAAPASAPEVEDGRVGMSEDMPPLVTDEVSTKTVEAVSPVVVAEPAGRRPLSYADDPNIVEIKSEGRDQNRTKLLQKIQKVFELLAVDAQYSEAEKAEIKAVLMRDLQRYDDIFSENGAVEEFEASHAKLSKILSRYSESSEEILMKAGLKVRITDVRMLLDHQDLQETDREIIESNLKADFRHVDTHAMELNDRYQGDPAEIVGRMVAEIRLPAFIVSIQNEMIELYRELSEAFKTLHAEDRDAIQALKNRAEVYAEFIDSISQPDALNHLEGKSVGEMIEILKNLDAALNELYSVKGAMIDALHEGIHTRGRELFSQYTAIADRLGMIEDASLLDPEFINPRDHASIENDANFAFDNIREMMRFLGQDDAFISAEVLSNIRKNSDRLVAASDRLDHLLEKRIESVQKRIVHLHGQLSDGLRAIKETLGTDYTLVNHDGLMAKKESLSELVRNIETLGTPENISQLSGDQKIEMLQYLKEQLGELNAALAELHQAKVEAVPRAEAVSVQPQASWMAAHPEQRSVYKVSISVSLNGTPSENMEYAVRLGNALTALSGDESLKMKSRMIEMGNFSVDMKLVCHDHSQLESIAAKVSEMIRTTDNNHVVFAADSSEARDSHENPFQKEFDNSINKDKGFTPGSSE